jgi:carbonic anhydrase
LQRIQEGVLKFRNRIFPSHRKTFEKLAAHQNPDTLFITCADSRIVPNLFTHTGPGDMFVERNPGNIVPAYNNDSAGELASIEYAVAILKVRNVIVCGHSDCGAMRGLLHPEKVAPYPAVARWLALAEPMVHKIDPSADEDEKVRLITELNVRTQLENLKQHPSIAARLKAGDIGLYGWVYEIESGHVRALDEQTGEFRLWPS